MTELQRSTARRGTVTSFDEYVGLGVLEDSEGHTYPFHCIEIASGSRDIALGAVVAFDVLAKFGRFEAANLRP